MSWIVAVIAEAVTGPTPGMVISRLAVSSALTDEGRSSELPLGQAQARLSRPQDEVGNRQTGYSFSQSALNLVSNLSPANRGFKAHIKQTVSMEGRRVGIRRQGAAD